MLFKTPILPSPVGSPVKPGQWVEIVYSASFLLPATRPVLNFHLNGGTTRRLFAPAPVLGSAIWIGPIPRRTVELTLESTQPLRIDRLSTRSLAWRAIAALRRHRRHSLAATALLVLGKVGRARNRMMRALTERPLEDYGSWAAGRRRRHEPDGLDRPSAEAMALRQMIEVKLPLDETLTPYALDAVATAFANDPSTTAIQGDSEIISATHLAAGFVSAWTPAQGAIFRRAGAKATTPTPLRRILTRHPARHSIAPADTPPINWPHVAIVVPTRDKLDLLRTCIDGVLSGTDYPSLSLIIADNQSVEAVTKAYLDDLPARDERVLVVTCPGAFNFSRICNRAATASQSELLVFLNNDTAVIDRSWLKSLVALAMAPDVGAVGPTLLYPNGRIQHAGVALGPGESAGHILIGRQYSELNGNAEARRVSAVTGACLVVRRDRFEAVGGFDPAFAVAYNDIDLCLRLGAKGWGAVWAPHVRLTHHESQSRGRSIVDSVEIDLFRTRWASKIADDPCFHPAFSNASLDLSLG